LINFEIPPGSHPEAPEDVLSLAIRESSQPVMWQHVTGCDTFATDPARPSRRGGSNSRSDCLNPIGLDKLISWINASRESVSLGQSRKTSHRASGMTRAKKFN